MFEKSSYAAGEGFYGGAAMGAGSIFNVRGMSAIPAVSRGFDGIRSTIRAGLVSRCGQFLAAVPAEFNHSALPLPPITRLSRLTCASRKQYCTRAVTPCQNRR